MYASPSEGSHTSWIASRPWLLAATMVPFDCPVFMLRGMELDVYILFYTMGDIDVTPQKFPVLVVGGMLSRTATEVHTPLFAKAIVLDDGKTRLAIVVVDSCAMPRSLLDEARKLACGRPCTILRVFVARVLWREAFPPPLWPENRGLTVTVVPKDLLSRHGARAEHGTRCSVDP